MSKTEKEIIVTETQHPDYAVEVEISDNNTHDTPKLTIKVRSDLPNISELVALARVQWVTENDKLKKQDATP